MDFAKLALEQHLAWQGKFEITSKVALNNKEDLSVAYTPGVAAVCEKIHQDIKTVYDYTTKANTIAIVTDGSAVLGLGDIGPEASLPVMEGKAILFKKFGGVNAVPICLATKNVEEIIQTIKFIAPGFGGINLEDISSPRCFEIEAVLINELDIPVFHDDQHGTAIVVLAALINALKIVKKDPSNLKIVINGAGAAGIAIAKLLIDYGFCDIVLCDRKGIIHNDLIDLNWIKKEILKVTNRQNLKGSLKEALIDADVFIGVSAPNMVTEAMVRSMKKNAIIFAMANPVPEIMPELAYNAGAKVIGTGRSDYPNQINNVLVFPGIFKGVLAVRAPKITTKMKLQSAIAIAEIILDTDLKDDYIIPKPFDERVPQRITDVIKRIC
ncbi:MAG: NADP-dependent malic enzyme [Candidatus Margulisiibacteriota bacterium]